MKKCKVVIVVGTRPNFIKITQFEKEFNRFGDFFDYKLVHTGQHYDQNMSQVFFGQLGLKKPDITLNVKGKTPAEQIGTIIIKLDEFFSDFQPNLVVVVGDVNSTLAAAVAANKRNIKLAHLESGLRSHDRAMPEEINRILTDNITNEFYVTEQSGMDNLEAEIKREANLHFVGNTMIDTLVAFEKDIQASPILEEIKVSTKDYALMTMHRPRNVDTKAALRKMLDVIQHITQYTKLVFPIHPRTTNSLKKHNLYEELTANKAVILTKPLGYLAFQKLIANSNFVLTDSGGIQEETTFRQVPCLTLRPNTERPVTVTIGTNELVPFDPKIIGAKIEAIHNGTYKTGVIPKFWDGLATRRIVAVMHQQHLEENNIEATATL